MGVNQVDAVVVATPKNVNGWTTLLLLLLLLQLLLLLLLLLLLIFEVDVGGIIALVVVPVADIILKPLSKLSYNHLPNPIRFE
jgi:hypothetical protein